MKDNLDNNLEDFLNSSMDQFDDVPSNQVWDSIEEKLDKEEVKPSFSKWKIFSLLMVAGVLIFSINLAQKNNDDIKSIKEEIYTLKNVHPEANKVLNTDLVENHPSELLEKEKESVESALKQNSQNEIAVDHATSDFSSRRQNSIDQSSIAKSISPFTSIAKKTDQNDQRSSKAESYSSNSASQASQSNIIRNHHSEIYSDKKRPSVNKALRSITLFDSQIHQLPIEERNHINLNLGEPIILKQDNKLSASKYRIGPNARYFNTFIKHNMDFNGSESYGLRHEYLLNDKWAITNSINFNVQHYDIKSSSGIVEAAIVREYTSRDFSDVGIKEIDVNAEYLDFPLGLKYAIGQSQKGWNYFVNPSAVWQIYLPQMFSFIQTDDNVTVRNDHRIIATLGSASLGLGMEKKISDHYYLQFSVWGEYGFIPLGTQRNKINMLGLRSALLFGK